MMEISHLPDPSAPVPLRILLADDNAALRAAVRGLLKGFGHWVDVATNGLEVIEAASKTVYDLYFLDIQMPVMGGLEAARALRLACHGERQPMIIGLSGEDGNHSSCEAAGMDDFFSKPVRIADLACVLGRIPRREGYHEPAAAL